MDGCADAGADGPQRTGPRELVAASILALPPAGVPNVASYDPAHRSLDSGTRIDATIQDAISSRTNKSGESLRARVRANVTDVRGRVVIPAGATVLLNIAEIGAGGGTVHPEGRLSLVVNSVMVNAQMYALTASMAPMVRTSHRDIVLLPGTAIAFTLTQSLTVASR